MLPYQAKALGAVFTTHSMQRMLYEATWSARALLKLDASIIFLSSSEDGILKAVAWDGREAADATLVLESQYIKSLWASRRSISWNRRERCLDKEIAGILESMDLSSGMVVPVGLNGVTIGVWLAAAASERSFTDNDEQILHTLTENISLTTESLLLSAENLRLQREANALYEIGKEISQLMDLDRVLEVICKKTCSLMGAEISYIALADDERQEVRVRVTEGTRNEQLKTMVLKYGEGVGGYVATTRQPLLVDNYPKDERPKPPGIAEIAATEDILSIISVPLFTRTGLIGVLFAASRKEAVFNQSQMNLLFALGTQAAIAIENARLYEQEKITAAKLKASMTTNEQLLQLVLGNQGLQVIADTLSQLVGCPIVIEDDLHRVLCSSFEGFTGSQEQKGSYQHLSALEVFNDSDRDSRRRALRETRQAVRLPPRPERLIPYSRWIAPIAAGENRFGYVSALEMGGLLNDQQRSAIEQASIVIALEFLKQETAREVEQRLAGDLLDDLIHGRGITDAGIYQRAARLNLDLRIPHRIMVLDIDQFGQQISRNRWTDLEALAVKRRFLNTVTEVVHQRVPAALVSFQSDSVLLLLPVSGLTETSACTGLGREVQTALRIALPALSVSVGIGRIAGQPAQLSGSFQEALLALQAAACLEQKGCVVAYEELGVLPLLLQSQDQGSLVTFKQRYLGALLAYDAENKTVLVFTLQVYLENTGNLQRTANACHVHLNSLKYRIQRIEEIAGLDLHDGQTRFNLQLALSIQNALKVLENAKK